MFFRITIKIKKKNNKIIKLELRIELATSGLGDQSHNQWTNILYNYRIIIAY
jgi:hypothetical protein